MSRGKEVIKYFPFCPGVPWYTRNGFISNHLSFPIWQKALKDKEVVILSGGGLLESFLSLSFAEIINVHFPNKKITWQGTNQFNVLTKYNGLAKIGTNLFDTQLLSEYPLPIFFDKAGTAYYNCLFNYINCQSFSSGKVYHNDQSLSKQLLNNLAQPWVREYTPQFRTLTQPPELISWEQLNRINNKKPYVCLFPDLDTGMSIHNFRHLDWTLAELKSFASMFYDSGIELIIITRKPGKYYDIRTPVMPFHLESALWLISEAKAILSEEVDWLFVANLLSEKAMLVGKKIYSEFGLVASNKYINKSNVIYTEKKRLNPWTVFQRIKNE